LSVRPYLVSTLGQKSGSVPIYEFSGDGGYALGADAGHAAVVDGAFSFEARAAIDGFADYAR